MKTLITFLLFISISYSAQSQYFFRKTYTGFSPFTYPSFITKSCINNDMFSVGRMRDSIGYFVMCFMICDSNGNIKTFKHFLNDYNESFPTGVTPTKDGGYLVSVESIDVFTVNMSIFKLDSVGNGHWIYDHWAGYPSSIFPPIENINRQITYIRQYDYNQTNIYVDDSSGNNLAAYKFIVDTIGDTLPIVSSITYGPNESLVGTGFIYYSIGYPFSFLLDTINNKKIGRKYYNTSCGVRFDKILRCNSGFIATGRGGFDSTGTCCSVAKLDDSLHIEWSVLLNVIDPNYAHIWDAVFDYSNNIILVLQSGPSMRQLIRIDSTGNNVQAFTVDSAILRDVCAYNDGFVTASFYDTLYPILAKYDWSLTAFNCGLTPSSITWSSCPIADTTFDFTLISAYHDTTFYPAFSWPDLQVTANLLCDYTVGINDNNFDPLAMIDIYPNPTFNNCSIHLNNNQNDLKISIRNPLGQLILKGKKIRSGETIDLMNQPQGMYYFYIESGKMNWVRKVIKM